MKLYAIRDIKANAFADPFHLSNDAVAVRAAKQAANDPSTHLFKNPEDYQLWYLGDYDTETGALVAGGGLLCNITSLKE